MPSSKTKKVKVGQPPADIKHIPQGTVGQPIEEFYSSIGPCVYHAGNLFCMAISEGAAKTITNALNRRFK